MRKFRCHGTKGSFWFVQRMLPPSERQGQCDCCVRNRIVGASGPTLDIAEYRLKRLIRENQPFPAECGKPVFEVVSDFRHYRF